VKLRLLGCGTSSGVPRVGDDWGQCDRAEPRNRRRRASILVEHGPCRILVDTSPDLREQLLDARVSDVEAVIWTHDHADHCHGIDDLRQLYHARGRPVNGYARPYALDMLRRRFAYAFEGQGGYPALVTGHELPNHINLAGMSVRTADQPHGPITSAGLRFDAGGAAIGYSTDFDSVTDDMAALLDGLDLWVVDALRRKPHPTHPHLAMTLDWIRKLAPKRAILTHMDNSMDYNALRAELPDGVEPGYDGLEIDL
jgi:phosphoribosyl 1,2-cyclic phosphate phosphodiesterase